MPIETSPALDLRPRREVGPADWTHPLPSRHPRQAALARGLADLIGRAEIAFAVVGLFLFTAALLPTLVIASGGSVTADAGNPILRIVYGSVQAGGLVLAAAYWRRVLHAIKQAWPALLLVAIALLSTLWSIDPDLTIRRSLAVAGTTAFGLYLGARFDRLTLLRMVAVALAAAAVLSLIFAVALPTYGIDQEVHVGAWRGVFTEKNGLGQIMALSVLVFVVLALRGGRGRTVAWAGAGLSVVLVVLSGSMTGLSVMAACLLLIPLYRALRLHTSLAIPILIACVLVAGVVGALLLENAQAILRWMGRDPTLTGRTLLWTTVLQMIADRPLLGHGFSAFWRGDEGPSGIVRQTVEWATPHSHNGFLDLLLDLGAVGLVVAVLLLGSAAVRGVREARADSDVTAIWPLLFVSFLMLYNMMESTLLQQNDILWALLVAVTCSGAVARARRNAAANAQVSHLRWPLRRLATESTRARPRSESRR